MLEMHVRRRLETPHEAAMKRAALSVHRRFMKAA
jgi:hypothetical protein